MGKYKHIENGEEPAMPFTARPEYQFNYGGLTKREYFAGLAMQGFMANANQECVDVGADGIAKAAVSVADALLAELEK